MKKTIIPLLLFLFLLSCKKEKDTGYEGIIIDYTGKLDGCGTLIELTNGKRLQVVANSSGKELIEGKRVYIKYISNPVFNTCMAGETVKITVLRYL